MVTSEKFEQFVRAESFIILSPEVEIWTTSYFVNWNSKEQLNCVSLQIRSVPMRKLSCNFHDDKLNYTLQHVEKTYSFMLN